MSDDSNTSLERTGCQSFSTTNCFVVGAGETLDEIQASGQWLKAANPVEIRR